MSVRYFGKKAKWSLNQWIKIQSKKQNPAICNSFLLKHFIYYEEPVLKSKKKWLHFLLINYSFGCFQISTIQFLQAKWYFSFDKCKGWSILDHFLYYTKIEQNISWYQTKLQIILHLDLAWLIDKKYYLRLVDLSYFSNSLQVTE